MALLSTTSEHISEIFCIGRSPALTGGMTVQALFRKYGLRQRDLTRALQAQSISRSYAHYIWHGVKPLSLNAALAIRRAFPDIPEKELFDVLEASRKHPPRP